MDEETVGLIAPPNGLAVVLCMFLVAAIPFGPAANLKPPASVYPPLSSPPLQIPPSFDYPPFSFPPLDNPPPSPPIDYPPEPPLPPLSTPSLSEYHLDNGD